MNAQWTPGKLVDRDFGDGASFEREPSASVREPLPRHYSKLQADTLIRLNRSSVREISKSAAMVL
jgi:hypothetical protein